MAVHLREPFKQLNFLKEKGDDNAIVTSDLEEIHMPKDEKLSKHQIIEKCGKMNFLKLEMEFHIQNTLIKPF